MLFNKSYIHLLLICSFAGACAERDYAVKESSDAVQGYVYDGLSNTVSIHYWCPDLLGTADAEVRATGVVLDPSTPYVLTAAHVLTAIGYIKSKCTAKMPKLEITYYGKMLPTKRVLPLSGAVVKTFYHPSVFRYGGVNGSDDWLRDTESPNTADLGLLQVDMSIQGLAQRESLPMDMQPISIADEAPSIPSTYYVDGTMADGAPLEQLDSAVTSAPRISKEYNFISSLYLSRFSTDLNETTDAGDSGAPVYQLQEGSVRLFAIHNLISHRTLSELQDHAVRDTVRTVMPYFLEYLEDLSASGDATLVARASRASRVDGQSFWGGVSAKEWIGKVVEQCSGQVDMDSDSCNARILCANPWNQEWGLKDGYCVPSCGQLGKQIAYRYLDLAKPEEFAGQSWRLAGVNGPQAIESYQSSPDPWVRLDSFQGFRVDAYGTWLYSPSAMTSDCDACFLRIGCVPNDDPGNGKIVECP
ncbi:MAG: trypsin-like peptidase domain-containing protein [Myxococcales bacterium]|nr:MAG: trypsin-like peptidase domain-containing protein [Myxococcales bacterium]